MLSSFLASTPIGEKPLSEDATPQEVHKLGTQGGSSVYVRGTSRQSEEASAFFKVGPGGPGHTQVTPRVLNG